MAGFCSINNIFKRGTKRAVNLGSNWTKVEQKYCENSLKTQYIVKI